MKIDGFFSVESHKKANFLALIPKEKQEALFRIRERYRRDGGTIASIYRKYTEWSGVKICISTFRNFLVDDGSIYGDKKRGKKTKH